jgi:threonine/homoserine/homoserine lactone efflux protein
VDGRFLAFLGVAVVLIVTPGPDTATVTRNAFRGGARGASLTALGVSLGLLTWGAASAAGLAALLAASALAFTVLRTAGAAVLAVMGLRSLVAAARGGGPAPENVAAAPRRAGPAFLQGLLGNLLNPKAGAIFLTVVPQFVRPGDPAARLAAMVVVFAAMVCAWLHLYGWLVARARRRFGGRLRRALDGVTGAVLIGLGARLATGSR